MKGPLLFAGRYASDDNQWPLDSQYESRILRNFRPLRELIDPEFLTTELTSAACINSLQECDVEDTRNEYDKANKLLHFLLQSSIDNYERFVKCLRNTEQHHVAKILETDVGELMIIRRYANYSCDMTIMRINILIAIESLVSIIHMIMVKLQSKVNSYYLRNSNQHNLEIANYAVVTSC